MASLEEMAVEYRKSAALLAQNIKKHEEAGDLDKWQMDQLKDSLKQIREVCHILSGYYDVPRPVSPYTLTGLRGRRFNP